MSPTGLLILVLLGCGAATACVAVVLLTWGLLHPPRMTDGKAIALLHRLSPGDLGLAFEAVQFTVRDQRGRALELSTWWIPATGSALSRNCALLLHGYGDAKVGALAWAPLFAEAGWNILALDLRAHGESAGECSTAGFFERHDVAQAIAELRARWPSASRQIVIFGPSLGAAIALAVAADNALDVAGVVLDSPYADYGRAAMAHFDRFGAPGRAFQLPALWLAQAMTGANFSAVAPLTLLPRVPVPVLMILPSGDPVVSDADRELLGSAMHDRANPLDQLWQVPEVMHLMALPTDPSEYRRRLHEFLDAVTSRVESSPAAIR